MVAKGSCVTCEKGKKQKVKPLHVTKRYELAGGLAKYLKGTKGGV